MDILDLQKWAYIEGLPNQNATVCELFQTYSGISDSDIENHLLHIVSQPLCAWETYAFVLPKLTRSALPPSSAETRLGCVTASVYRALEVPRAGRPA